MGEYVVENCGKKFSQKLNWTWSKTPCRSLNESENKIGKEVTDLDRFFDSVFGYL